MCGIAGIFRWDDQPIEVGRLEGMQRRIACRGPDAQTSQVAGRCGLVHVRLAVLDPVGGHQPMVLKRPRAGGAGDLSLIFNGEIYNHRELRRQLETLGHRFTTDHSDTEVVLHGYAAWGEDLPNHLRGMFAFAVHDGGDGSLFLARDRAGKKPLFLHRSPRELVFASLVSAVAGALDHTPAIDSGALLNYLTFGYSFERSLFDGITELPAGHWMRVHRDGRSEQARYWSPPLPLGKPPFGVLYRRRDNIALVRTALHEAVVSRLEADVPLGCFLSGGIDSSIIAALAQQELSRRGERLKTFSVAMPDARYDEGPHAKMVAEHIGAEHHALTAEPHVEEDLKLLIASMGQPLGDSSILPTYWVSRAARRHVTVALSGDGGDELFAGYERYRALRLLRHHRWWLRVLAMLPLERFGGGEQKSLMARFARLAQAARRSAAAQQYLNIVRLFTPQQLQALGIEAMAGAMPNWPEIADRVDAARRWDMEHYLPFDLLRKVDRASMAVALEVRCPMLDTAVYELAARLPRRVLMPRGRPKGLLRRVAAQLLPRQIVRRPKMGFAVPIGGWFGTSLRPMVQGHLIDAPSLAELGLRREGVETLVSQHMRGEADHSQRLFALLSLSMWQQWRRELR